MISAGSIMRPEPVMPEARRPTAGPATVMPRDLSVSTLCCVAGLSYMWPSMAGQTTTGARVASTVVVRASSASPWAMRAMVLAVAGATTTRSARSAMATWSILSSVLGSNMSVTTGRWVMLPKARGDANLVAASVMTTSTIAPCWVSLLARSTALWQAMLPETPSAMVLPSSGCGISWLPSAVQFVDDAQAGKGEVLVNRVEDARLPGDQV